MTAPVQPDGTISKSEFAELLNVSIGRVCQYIAEGKLDGAALVGEGRGQRIHVEHAKAQLRARLNAAQMRGNGKTTRLDRDAANAAWPVSVTEADVVDLANEVAAHFHLQKTELLRVLAREFDKLRARESAR